MKNFFRKDLKLEKKWWHRLIRVAWILSIIAVLFVCGIYIDEGYYGRDYDAYRIYVGPLQDRTNNKIKDINDLLKPGEHADFTPDSHSNKYDLTTLLDVPYGITRCSNGWDASKISMLNKSLGGQLVKGGDAISKYKTYGEIANSIEGDCIFLVDGVFHYDGGSLYIYTVHRPNKFKVTMGWLLPRLGESILYILVYIGLSWIIYYKGVLYIIYGKSE